MHRFLITTTAVLALLAQPLQAATITGFQYDQNNYVITVNGTINTGDDDVFAALVKTNSGHGIVIFNSNGGSTAAGIEIGVLIHNSQYATVVQDENVCASACAIAWLGGTTLWAGPNAQIGFHGTFIYGSNGELQTSSDGNAVVGAYMANLGLSYKAIILFNKAAPNDMHILTAAEAEEIGLTVYQFKSIADVTSYYTPSDQVFGPAASPPTVVVAPPPQQLTDYQIAGQQRARDIMSRMGRVNWASLGRWIQTASRQDLNEAIEIASEISQRVKMTVAVLHAANGWHAVMLGPYNAVPTVNLSELIATGVIPNDSFIKVGTQYNEMEWASPSWSLTATTETSWSYGGSTFTLQQDGDNRRLIYANPVGLPAYVTEGTVFFEGKRIGRQYQGTIYVYSTNCGPKSFQIVGSIVDDHTIEFHGWGPRRDDNCNVKYINYQVTLTRIIEMS